MPYSFELKLDGKTYYFCHAGVDPDKPLNEQEPDDLLWIREKFWAFYEGEEIVVVGHTPIQKIKSEAEIEASLEQALHERRSDGENFYAEEIFYVDSATAGSIQDCKPQWRRGGKVLLMDTGSFRSNGKISCVDVLSGTIWQSD